MINYRPMRRSFFRSPTAAVWSSMAALPFLVLPGLACSRNADYQDGALNRGGKEASGSSQSTTNRAAEARYIPPGDGWYEATAINLSLQRECVHGTVALPASGPVPPQSPCRHFDHAYCVTYALESGTGEALCFNSADRCNAERGYRLNPSWKLHLISNCTKVS